jgi:hypothetical protein
MKTKIACSVCHAAIASGAVVCLGCGLPLVAQAVPVIRRRKSAWPFFLSVIGVFLLIAWIGSESDKNAIERRRGELKAALVSGKLSTPETFQARCGHARWTKQTKDGTELHYLISASDYFVTFAGAAPRFQGQITDWSEDKPSVFRVNLDADDALDRFGCQ